MVQDMIKILDQYWDVFLEGLGGTLSLAAITVFFGMIFWAVLAIIKLSKSKIVQFISTAYIEIIRGTPLLLQLYVFWLFFPKLSVPEFKRLTKDRWRLLKVLE